MGTCHVGPSRLLSEILVNRSQPLDVRGGEGDERGALPPGLDWLTMRPHRLTTGSLLGSNPNQRKRLGGRSGRQADASVDDRLHAPTRADRRGSAWDAVLYAASAAMAAAVGLFSATPIHAEWGRLAVGPYAAGAIVAFALAALRPPFRARIALALAVALGSVATPLALEVVWRAESDPGFHAQSEVIITEEASRSLVAGHNPYLTNYTEGPLASRPPGTRNHFPYFPATLLFGLARGLGLPLPLADARIAFVLTTLLAMSLAFRASSMQGSQKLRIAQVLIVLPTGALPMATGGHDLPVLALMLCTCVFVSQGRWKSAGLSAGLCAAMKPTGLLLLPLLLWTRDGRRSLSKPLLMSVAVWTLFSLPFLAWAPAAFLEDTVMFPLGFGRQPSSAAAPTIGSLVVRVYPQARGASVLLLVSAEVLFAIGLTARLQPKTTTDGMLQACWIMAAAVALAPTARFAYWIYPANLAVWASAFIPIRHAPNRFLSLSPLVSQTGPTFRPPSGEDANSAGSNANDGRAFEPSSSRPNEPQTP